MTDGDGVPARYSRESRRTAPLVAARNDVVEARLEERGIDLRREGKSATAETIEQVEVAMEDSGIMLRSARRESGQVRAHSGVDEANGLLSDGEAGVVDEGDDGSESWCTCGRAKNEAECTTDGDVVVRSARGGVRRQPPKSCSAKRESSPVGSDVGESPRLHRVVVLC